MHSHAPTHLLRLSREFSRRRVPRTFAVRVGLVGILTVVAAAGATAAPAQRTSTAPADLRVAANALVAAGAPGVVVLVRDGNRTIQLARGYSNVAARTPMRTNDRFRIGSVTKTYVATIVLQLVGEGKLSLSDAVERWLPGLVRNGENITIRQLLNHTSGLAEYADDAFAAKLVSNPTRRWTPRQLVALGAAKAPTFAPGTGWSYSNTNYHVAALIIEAATGNSLRTELTRRIFRPLGLRATTFDSNLRIAGLHAHGYTVVDKPPAQDITNRLSPTWSGAAGAIVSTASDVALFERALLGGRLLRPELLRAMQTTVRMSPGESYGLGLWQTRSLAISATFQLPCGPVWGHNGSVPGYVANAFASKDGKRQLVVLANTNVPSQRFQQALGRLVATAFCG